MKKVMLLSVMLLSSIGTSHACDMFQARKTILKKISAMVGRPADDSSKVISVSNINVIVEEQAKGKAEALFTFEKVIGKETGESIEFNMIGRATLNQKCQITSQLVLGNHHVN